MRCVVCKQNGLVVCMHYTTIRRIQTLLRLVFFFSSFLSPPIIAPCLRWLVHSVSASGSRSRLPWSPLWRIGSPSAIFCRSSRSSVSDLRAGASSTSRARRWALDPRGLWPTRGMRPWITMLSKISRGVALSLVRIPVLCFFSWVLLGVYAANTAAVANNQLCFHGLLGIKLHARHTACPSNPYVESHSRPSPCETNMR